MKNDQPTPNPSPSKQPRSGERLAAPSGSVWCVVCQGSDEISEPMLMQDGLPEAVAKEIANSTTQSMWAITMAWPKSRYDAWKKKREELMAMMRGKTRQKVVVFSTPNGAGNAFYDAWINSQNVKSETPHT